MLSGEISKIEICKPLYETNSGFSVHLKNWKASTVDY